MAAVTLFDTDVLVDLLRGHAGARAEVLGLASSERCVSAVTYMELIEGARDRRERDAIVRFIRSSFGDIVHVDESASRAAGELVHDYALSHGLRIPDALIAATARARGLKLVTGNLRHFDFVPGLQAGVPSYRAAP